MVLSVYFIPFNVMFLEALVWKEGSFSFYLARIIYKIRMFLNCKSTPSPVIRIQPFSNWPTFWTQKWWLKRCMGRVKELTIFFNDLNSHICIEKQKRKPFISCNTGSAHSNQHVCLMHFVDKLVPMRIRKWSDFYIYWNVYIGMNTNMVLK